MRGLHSLESRFKTQQNTLNWKCGEELSSLFLKYEKCLKLSSRFSRVLNDIRVDELDYSKYFLAVW